MPDVPRRTSAKFRSALLGLQPLEPDARCTTCSKPPTRRVRVGCSVGAEHEHQGEGYAVAPRPEITAAPTLGPKKSPSLGS